MENLDLPTNNDIVVDYTCDCNNLTGEHNKGLVCHICGTVCKVPDEEMPAVETQPVTLDPTQDYLEFEGYLRVMRDIHQYASMSAQDALQFDNAVVYRWRDVKALRYSLEQITNDPTSNPYTRLMKEFKRVNANADRAYLELSNIRRFIGLELGNLTTLLKHAKKKGSTVLATQYSALASRLERHSALMGNVVLGVDVQQANDALALEQRKNRFLIDGLKLQAEYHLGHAKNASNNGDEERAKRHHERHDTLMKIVADVNVVVK